MIMRNGWAKSIHTNKFGSRQTVLDSLIPYISIMLEPFLDSFSNRIGPAEFRPEFTILFLPVGAETPIKIVTQFFKKQFPGRLTALVSP